MELTDDQKQTMVEARLFRFKQQLFDLEIDKKALLAINDTEGVKGIEVRIEALEKAYKAVQEML